MEFAEPVALGGAEIGLGLRSRLGLAPLSGQYDDDSDCGDDCHGGTADDEEPLVGPTVRGRAASNRSRYGGPG